MSNLLIFIIILAHFVGVLAVIKTKDCGETLAIVVIVLMFFDFFMFIVFTLTREAW